MTCIGLIGGMSWESTGAYYSHLNQMTLASKGSWQQPHVLIDSLDFGEIVTLQREGAWDQTGRILAESAKRLEGAGATVLAITANTMHINYDDVAASVAIPVIDIRDAIARELNSSGFGSISLLGTKYVMEEKFFTSHLERAGIRVVVPDGPQRDELQRMIYEELTRGIVSEGSRHRFIEIASDCQSRGGDVIGLCCTEFGMLIDAEHAPWPFIDSTVAHVKALLRGYERES